MKLPIILFASAALVTSGYAAESKALTTQKEKASYGVGMNVAKRFKSDLIDLDVDAFMQGFRDVLTDKEPAVNQEEIAAALEELRKEVEAKATEAAAKMKTEGEAFLAANKQKENVKVTDSGLQYKALKEGTGPSPKPTDRVRVHYKGTLIDGTVFDSSYDRGEPAVFGLNQVIPGWGEALQMMKVGGKWQIFLPSEIGYGQNPPPGSQIPPNAPLVFEVELLGIENSNPGLAPGQP